MFWKMSKLPNNMNNFPFLVRYELQLLYGRWIGLMMRYKSSITHTGYSNTNWKHQQGQRGLQGSAGSLRRAWVCQDQIKIQFPNW